MVYELVSFSHKFKFSRNLALVGTVKENGVGLAIGYSSWIGILCSVFFVHSKIKI